MAIPFLSNINMNQNEIQNLVIHKQTSDPTGAEGQIYYNSSTDKVKIYNGSAWISIAGDIEEITSATTNQLTVANGTGPAPALTIVTAAIANGGTGLATADQIHTFVTTQTDSIAADTSGTAAKVTVTEDTSSNTNYNVVFHNGSNALLDESSTGGFHYNPSTETLSVKNLSVTVKTTQKEVELINTSGGVVFEGDTANDFETTLDVVDATADRTINLPNASGTVQLVGDATREFAVALNASEGTVTKSTNTYTVTHSLNSRDVACQVYHTSNYDTVHVDITRATVNTVEVAFGQSVTDGDYKILITKIG
tara:strand:+ start:25 stop:954 length:930 start_codon:yes stop_codon:yes gene_type:complete